MSELKQCPRCGAEAHVVTEDSEPTMFLCEDCGYWLDVSEFETTENAFKWWNDRPFIDALNARIAELEAAQRWIPVSERLPEVDQDVLVFDQRGDITIDYLVALNREGVAYYTNSDDGAVCWMPLPEPPEVQE